MIAKSQETDCMPKPLPQCIFFDVDGVLLDSLPQHLQICRDLAAQYNLPLTVPTVPQMRLQISAGLKVSPMRELFLAVGFPPDRAAQALDEYQDHFAKRYHPQLFPGVPDMLDKLHHAGLPMGLVTANLRENVEPALRDSMHLFDPRALFFYHPSTANITKAAALAQGAQKLGAALPECVYVGDQPSDEAAAIAAGCQFLGVTYGWGITGDEGRFDVARNIADIPNAVLRKAIVAA
jgi:phosphoglycolate phosphatase-like HAD superfamily hydrolase